MPQMGPDDSEEKAPCPGCGRIRWVWALTDMRGVKAKRPDLELPEYACGGCRGRLERTGMMTRLEMAKAIGAPAHVIERFERASARRR